MASRSASNDSEPQPAPRLSRWLTAARQPAVLLAVATAVAVIVVATFYSYAYRGNVVDDALISLVYAKNIAIGEGAVFNPGERVEGYTSFLWIVLTAPLYWLSRALGSDFVGLAVKLSIGLAAANVLLIYAIGRRLWGRNNRALLALVAALGLCAADNSFTVWAALAMEKQLVAFWVLAATYFSVSNHRRRTIAVGLCLAALQMTRPDAALFGIAMVVSQLIEAAACWRGKAGKAGAQAQLRELASFAAVWLVAYGVYFVWRYSYYGYFFPNTYYVKLASEAFDGWSRGLDYLHGFLQQRGYTPLLAAVAVLWARNKTVRTLCLWAAAHLLYVTYAGGDFYPGHRFFVFLVPVLALLSGQVVYGLMRLMRSQRARRTLPAVAEHGAAVLWLLVALGLLRFGKIGVERGPYETEIKRWGAVVEQQRQGVLWLAQQAPPGSSIYAGRIGSMGLYTDLHVYDFFGITDPAIAHQQVEGLGQGKAGHEKRASAEYVLTKNPTYVVDRYLRGVDLWSHGYMYDADVPLQGGLWVRAPIARGAWQQISTFTLDARTPRWHHEGEAFANWPSHRSGGVRPTGCKGRFVTSYSPQHGDDATGTLTSAPFTVRGELISLRVGGGHDKQLLTVSLIVDGEQVASSTGRRNHTMSRRVWDTAAHRGAQATIEIADRARGGWGHIIVDEIVQWQAVPR